MPNRGPYLPPIMAAPKGPQPIKIGQINLGGAAVATNELPTIARALELDVVLVQEQFSQPPPGLVQHGSSAKAGLLVVSASVAVVALDHLSSSHCFVAAVRKGGVEIILVSAYFQYSEAIDPHLHNLEKVLDSLGPRPVVIGVDANAHSPVWHSQPRHYIGRGYVAEHRRRAVEDFIAARGLVLANAPNQPATFSGPNGESNIDLTIATGRSTVSDWRVHDGVSSSDHRLISYSAVCGHVRRAAACAELVDGGPTRFRENGVDWAFFQATIGARVGLLDERKNASTLAKELTDVVVRTAHECLGVRGPSRDSGYEWWSHRLDAMRRKVGYLRCAWQSTRRQGGQKEERAREAFHAERRRYRRLMVETQNSFHLREAESGNEDPFGQAYRVACGRYRPPANVINGIKYANGHSESVGEAVDNLLHALCPDDDPSTDTEYHRKVRLAASCIPSGCDAAPLTRDSLQVIVRSLPNTAPGIDGITARMVKHVWAAASAELVWVYGKCVMEGVFPDVWKDGRLIVLPKGNDKPLTDPKAYRPITLLPVFGKILERILLQCAPQITRGISPCQHGFSVGRSTVTALSEILSTCKTTESKYVQAIFLDISGAFDNAWWPMIMLKAKRGGCPPNIYRMLSDYFRGRRVGMFVGDQVQWKVSTMGCPQGSVLGPSLWNVLLDDLLRLPLPGGVKIVAYADDVTVLVEGSSRRRIESAAADSIHLFEGWAQRNRLSFAPAKSQSVTLRGRLQRAPVIKLGGASIRNVQSAVVLGVTIDSSLSFAEHARSIGERAANCFGKMSRVSTSSWGIRYPALRILYYATYVASVTYAAACWAERATLYVVRTSLVRSQRPALILLTKAYRSNSAAALAVLAGVLPADLEVIRAARVDKARRSAAKGELSRLKREISTVTVEEWQERWTSETKGGELRRFFPDVAGRLRATWVAPDYETSQVLTGHGCFNKRLHGMCLVESAACLCGMAEEDLHHVLWECVLYGDLRCNLLDGIVREEEGPVYYQDLVSSVENFGKLREFAHQWHKRRNSLEQQ